MSNVTPSRPYLVRALNEWILDNECTPYVLVDAGLPGVQVPQDFVTNGQIVLNISPRAVKDLTISNEMLSFSARFGGVPMMVSVPMLAILAIYAKENGQGMVFGHEAGAPDPNEPSPVTSGSTTPSSEKRAEKKRPSLKVVK